MSLERIRRWRCAGMAALLLPLLHLLPGLALADDSENQPAPLAQISVPTEYAASEAPISTVPWYAHIQQAASAYGVDVHLLHAVVAVFQTETKVI